MSIENSEYLFMFGRRLAEERSRLGYSQQTLAALTAKTPRTQIKYESDETRPDAAYFLTLSKLGFDVLYIITSERSAEGLTSEEQALLVGYRSLDERGKAGVLALIGGMTQSPQAIFHGAVGQAVQGNVTAPVTIHMGKKKKPDA